MLLTVELQKKSFLLVNLNLVHWYDTVLVNAVNQLQAQVFSKTLLTKLLLTVYTTQACCCGIAIPKLKLYFKSKMKNNFSFQEQNACGHVLSMDRL